MSRGDGVSGSFLSLGGNRRAHEIDTKLKLAKREFKNGLFIEEMLK